MQNRMESNIRDKLLVKMIKLQEFTEKKRIAEMLNEMNPKLKALLAAGLIGTAGLGMQSCSNPSDSVYYPYTVEAPSTDNPGSGGGTVNPGNGGGAETSNPSGGNGGETVNEVTFIDLGVTDENDQERLRHVTPMSSGLVFVDDAENHVYMGKEDGFVTMSESEMETEPVSFANTNALRYLSEDGNHVYHIPENMKTDFIAAGAKL